MSRYEMACEGGTSAAPDRISSRVNQDAASSSPVTRTRLPGSAVAWKPIMIEAGNGQGWEESYLTLVTCTAVSSSTSRAPASSSLLFGLLLLLLVVYRRAGQVVCCL